MSLRPPLRGDFLNANQLSHSREVALNNYQIGIES
jgi:hypothetical protein